jgi:hypothetical protein
MRRFAVLVAAVALVACGTTWSKEGSTPAQAAKDLAECNSLAESATQTQARINQDILSTRGKDWQDTGALPIVQQNYQAASPQQSTDIVSRCMIGKGYVPGG